MIGRRVVCGLMAGLMAAVAAGQPVGGHASTGVDALVFDGILGGLNPQVTLFNHNGTLGSSTFGFSGVCIQAGIPSFLSTDDGLGTCGAISGSGTYSYEVCGSGIVAASLTVTEPSGETASTQFTMLLVAGIGVAEGSFTDDGGSGVAAGVGVVIPAPPTGCESTVSEFQADIALVGVHT